MDNKNVSPFSQQLIGMLMEGIELPTHIVDAINSYYKLGQQQASMPQTQVSPPQMPGAQQQANQVSPDMLRSLLMQSPSGQQRSAQPSPAPGMNQRMSSSFPFMSGSAQDQFSPTQSSNPLQRMQRPTGPIMPGIIGPLKG